ANFNDGRLFKISTTDATCTATPFQPNQQGLDLHGGGIALTTDWQDGVMFDLNRDGVKYQVQWTQANGANTDAWLVYDDVHTGGQAGIQSGLELFGDQHGDPNGLARLSVLDTNGDGVFNASDVAYGDLQLWQDINQNGISEENELSSL